MYLEQLQLTGFKSFGQKTILGFRQAPQKNIHNIIAIVGKNGIGKSNIGDAIRWVLGEQSIKSLRAKNSADIIFTGKNNRMNLAEVSLTFNNEDKKIPIDYNEVTITRRLYRNGENEYFINKNKVRLNEILILLAQANIGQKSYSIIGQGAADAILRSSPIERKKFFDEATGIKQYQIKRDSALRKIEKSKNHLREAEIALSEIEPRLRSLTRQINKIKKREEIEKNLYDLQKKYYKRIWVALKNNIDILNKNLNEKSKIKKNIENELVVLRQETTKMVYEKPNENFQSLQELYYKLSREKNQLIEERANLKAKLTIIQQQSFSQQNKTEVPQNVIYSSLKTIKTNADKLSAEILNKNINEISLNKIKLSIKDFVKKINNLLNLFKQDNILEDRTSEIKKIAQTLKDKEEKIDIIEKKIDETVQKQRIFQDKESKGREKLFAYQKKIEKKQAEIDSVYKSINDIKIELAKLETKENTLEEEIKNEMKISIEEFNKSISLSSSTQPNQDDEYENKLEQINKLKRELELIGGIDPEVTKEYPKIKSRYDFLNSQSIDLKKSIKNLKQITVELDTKIKNKFKQNFSKINQEFDKYFKIFFVGGKAHLELEENIVENKEGQESHTSIIDIKVTIPGKKIKSVEVLSGGEKALISFALISSIISINKPPFVLLDEVDASLDEENSAKLVKILNELNKNTQFIVITHNRQIMESSDILYGVNMDPDGLSHLISLKL